MDDRARIISEIRRLAKSNSGYISLRKFSKATGISEHQMIGKYWATWGEALSEAGISTKSFSQPPIADNRVLQVFAELMQRLEKWPTHAEMKLEHHHNASFPSFTVFRSRIMETNFAEKVLEYCETRNDLGLAASILRKRLEAESSKPPTFDSASVVGYVYMMKSGRRYKIGHTNSVSRRHREIKLDLPDPTSVVHSIQTDDPAGIEAYWHNRFRSKRIRDTEFFELDASEVAAFKRRKYQ